MPAQFQGQSVLVVDDDPDIASALNTAFTSSGAKVQTARDGNAAIEMVKRHDPDLVVLDMMLPKRSGFLIMESIKPDRDASRRPHVIMITANEGKRHELYAKHLGVDEYLTKPFSMERLLEAACRLLGAEYREPDGQ